MLCALVMILEKTTFFSLAVPRKLNQLSLIIITLIEKQIMRQQNEKMRICDIKQKKFNF